MTNEVELFSWICDYQIENSILISRAKFGISTRINHRDKRGRRKKKSSVPGAKKKSPEVLRVHKIFIEIGEILFQHKFPTAFYGNSVLSFSSTVTSYFRSSSALNWIPFDLSLIYWFKVGKKRINETQTIAYCYLYFLEVYNKIDGRFLLRRFFKNHLMAIEQFMPFCFLFVHMLDIMWIFFLWNT